jgi:hypothetical protein
MASATGSFGEAIDFRPRSRKVCISLGIGLAAGLANLTTILCRLKLRQAAGSKELLEGWYSTAIN